MYRSNILKWIMIISILSVISLPLFTVFFLSPSFEKFLMHNIEERAGDDVKCFVANFIQGHKMLTPESISQDLKDRIYQLIETKSIVKIKIFSSDGTTLFSAIPSEINKKNSRSYFRNIVAKGQIFSKTIRRGEKSPEDQIPQLDVIETYLPVLDGKRFMGAFKISYDVTESKKAIDNHAAKIILIVFLIALLLIVAIFLSLYRAQRAISKHAQSEAELREHKEKLELMVTERTGELTRINTFLSGEIKERMSIELALRESKLRYKNLVELAPDFIYTLDNEGRFVFINELFYQVLRLSLDDTIGKSWTEIIHSDDREKSQKKLEDLLRKGNDVLDFENRIITGDGRTLFVSHSMRLTRNDNGAISGCQCIARDITLRKQMEEEIIRNRNIESIGVLAGGIAHDFNNLLTVVMGNISILESMIEDDSDLLEIIKHAKNASLQAKELTLGLLTFSRGGEPCKTTSSIVDLLKETAGFILRGTGIKLEYNMPDDLWPVDADMAQLGQVINNLLINAREAMPNGGTVGITASNEALTTESSGNLEPGDYVSVSINDTGVGIPQKDLVNIFNPYFTTKKMGAQKGVGLGLSICYSIVKSHNGIIQVDSMEGEGTVIKVYLPASEKEIEHETPEPVQVQEQERKNARILVMDDEEIVRKTIGFMLQKLGCSVDFAVNGTEAVKRYHSMKEAGEVYDAVILDLTVPGEMGGKTAIKKMLEIDPEINAIVSSGYFDDPVIAHYRKYGFKGVLAKPFIITELKDVLHNVMEKTIIKKDS
jgi:PAS domain S-box-containing protein